MDSTPPPSRSMFLDRGPVSINSLRHSPSPFNRALTEADSTWQSFLTTPPVPDYPSTHTVLGWAAAEVLIELLGDAVPYELTSLTLPGGTRSYRGCSTRA